MTTDLFADDRPHKPGDGRFAHSARTRAKILQAWVDIDREGTVPTVEKIVARSKVSRPSFFRLTSIGQVREAGLDHWLRERGVTTLAELFAYERAVANSLRDEADSLATTVQGRDRTIAVARLTALVDALQRIAEVRERWTKAAEAGT